MTTLSLIGSLTLLAATIAALLLTLGLAWDAKQALHRAIEHRAMARKLARKGQRNA